jgi:outer membrane lipoprotein-sorting protein
MKTILKLVGVPLTLLLAGSVPASSQTAPQASPPATTPAASLAPPPAKQDEALPTLDQLVEKCAKANGGKEAWAKLSTLVMTGTMDLPTYSMSGKIEVYAKAPNKILRIVDINEGQYVQKTAFDGKAGWKSDPQAGLRPLAGPELEEAKAESAFDTEVRLKEIYPDMKVTGRTKLGDRDAFTVLTHEGRKTLTFYFDAQTGLRIGEDSEGPDENGTVQKIHLTFEDYGPVAGGSVQIPHKIRGTSPVVTFEMQFKDAQFNVTVDDAKFAMPPAGS